MVRRRKKKRKNSSPRNPRERLEARYSERSAEYTLPVSIDPIQSATTALYVLVYVFPVLGFRRQGLLDSSSSKSSSKYSAYRFSSLLPIQSILFCFDRRSLFIFIFLFLFEIESKS